MCIARKSRRAGCRPRASAFIHSEPRPSDPWLPRFGAPPTAHLGCPRPAQSVGAATFGPILQATMAPRLVLNALVEPLRLAGGVGMVRPRVVQIHDKQLGPKRGRSPRAGRFSTHSGSDKARAVIRRDCRWRAEPARRRLQRRRRILGTGLPVQRGSHDAARGAIRARSRG